jgi:hypothetical protein
VALLLENGMVEWVKKIQVDEKEERIRKKDPRRMSKLHETLINLH